MLFLSLEDIAKTRPGYNQDPQRTQKQDTTNTQPIYNPDTVKTRPRHTLDTSKIRPRQPNVRPCFSKERRHIASASSFNGGMRQQRDRSHCSPLYFALFLQSDVSMPNMNDIVKAAPYHPQLIVENDKPLALKKG